MTDLLKDEIKDRVNVENSNITAKEYFDKVKNLKHVFTEKDLEAVYENCLYLANKAYVSGQTKALKKLIFCMETLSREKQLIDLGINTFVYMDDIDYFIDEVMKKSVKIIELKNYEREIPDDILEIVAKTKDIFDAFYVVFTDYSGKITRQVAKEKRDKDPILFGSFQHKDYHVIVDRFYYLGDWEDEYCDLTLEKMVNHMKEANVENIVHTIGVPKSLDELRLCLNAIDENGLVHEEWIDKSVENKENIENKENDKEVLKDESKIDDKEDLNDESKIDENKDLEDKSESKKFSFKSWLMGLFK